jgi:hypothetical protein
MMSSETQVSAFSQQHPPTKFSRYRSVRQANRIKQASPPAIPLQTTSACQNASFAESPAKYHKRLNSTDTIGEMVAGQRARPAAPLHSYSASLGALTSKSYPEFTTQDAQVTPTKTLPKDDAFLPTTAQTKLIARPAQHSHINPTAAAEKERQMPYFGNTTDHKMAQVAVPENEMSEGAREKLRAEEERARRIKAKRDAAREFERSNGMTLASKVQSESLVNTGEDARKASRPISQGKGPTLTTSSDRQTQGQALAEAKVASPNKILDTAGDGTQVDGIQSGQIRDSDAGQPSPGAVRGFSLRRKLTRSIRRRPHPPSQQLHTPAEVQRIRPDMSPPKSAGQNPVISDVPRSAVNAGERRVVIKYGESVTSLPITPTTTPHDLLKSTSTSMSAVFDPHQCLLWESFTQLGLERPLRGYEHVRDVLNSWDYDAQNHLVVMAASANASSNGDLDPRALPKQPGSTSLYMYHSQRPGKWEKRWVSLKDDGQISISKRQDGSASSSLCHLSDFDIYKPNQRQMKKLKPPKKICFAIKSQQKSAMFLDGANFVHFFATSDGPLTETWYSAIRTWRSWYLVNVLGEGQKREVSKRPSQENSLTSRMMPVETSEQFSPVRRQLSKPDFPNANSSTKVTPRPQSSREASNRDLRVVSSRGRSAPPSSFPHHQIQQSDPSIRPSSSRRAPSLSRGTEKAASIRSDAEKSPSIRRSTSLSRSGSIHQKPKPLVDLTPQFQEQPQHVKKGRGVAPVPGKPLIELATDVETLPGAIVIPAARAWQRPKDTSIVTNSGNAMTMKSSSSFTEPSSNDLAFTGTGLLGRNKSRRAQGGIGHGYGIKTGDRNQVGKPLVDLRMGSYFSDGSLLRQVETFNGEDERGLVFDRAKRLETDIQVGEGV